MMLPANPSATITDRNGDDFAVFSQDRAFRFQLDRVIVRAPQLATDFAPTTKLITFIMLNPSTADAFKNDPTVSRCIHHARVWFTSKDSFGNGLALRVVNLFSFRTPYPKDLKAWHAAGGAEEWATSGHEAENRQCVLAAVQQADMVIAGWGLDGKLGNAGKKMRDYLAAHKIRLHHLGLSKGGYPKHPLARGKSRIPSTQLPIPWNYA